MAKEKEIDIIALEFPENVRTRPGMYIGATDCPDVILREAIDNSIDELMGSQSCNKLDIQIRPGQSGSWYVVADNGRGIPIIMDEAKGITKTELAVSSLNAGSKFKKGEGDVSTGLNGVGVSCTNALSTRFVILSKITDQNARKSIPAVESLYNQLAGAHELFYVLEFNQGVKVNETASIKKDVEDYYGFTFPEGMSTITAFIPDPQIWKSIVANYSKKSLSYVSLVLDKFYSKQCEITIDGKSVSSEFEPHKYDFRSDIRIEEYGKVRAAQFYVNFDVSKDLSQSEFTGSVNSLIVNRGVHIEWIKRIYTDALKKYYNIQHDYLLQGLMLNVVCLTANTDFSSQTKERCVKIDNLYIDEIQPMITKEFYKIFKNNEEYFKAHVNRLNEFADAVTKISAIQKVKQVVGTVDGGNRVRSKLPSSVKDAASNDRSKCSLYVVEGKSASGTMLKARNPEFHAILELRGMVMNSINSDLDAIMENAEMCNLITCIGAGVNEYFNIDSCRYGKVILAADSDYYGEKINAMLLGFIARKMTFLLQTGRVYIALAPLYQQGDKYAYPGEDFRSIIDMDKPFKRYKGIGEINVKEAKDFYFNEKARLIKVTADNLEYVFDLLTTTYERKALMMQHKVLIDKYNTGII